MGAVGVVWWWAAGIVAVLVLTGAVTDWRARRRRRHLGLARPTPTGDPPPYGHAEHALDSSPALREEAHRPRQFPGPTGGP